MSTLCHMQAPAKLEHLEELLGAICSSARQAGVENSKIEELQVAAEEALVNVFHYAYLDGEGDVEVACKVMETGEFVVEITDRGRPFDPTKRRAPDTSADIEHRRIGGLGILLIKKLMNDMKYRRESEKNILSLVVSRPTQ